GARGLLTAATEEALQRLVDVLGRDEDPAAQLAVCQELQAREAPPLVLVDAVVRLLDSPRKDVGDAAGRAIGQFDRAEVIPRLTRVASGHGPTGNGRTAAITALGRMGMATAAIDALMDLLGESEGTLQTATLAALERATGLAFPSADEARRWWKANR